MRLMGIDYGTKRIGVAVSDPLGWTAQPVDVLKNAAGVFNKIKTITDKYSVTEIIIGFPKTMENEVSFAAKAVESFSKKIGQALKLPVILYDERLTTKSVEKELISHGVRREKRKEVIDKLAAAYMLQGYLDKKHRESAKTS